MTARSVLAVHDLTVQFGTLKAVDNASLALQSNQILALIGPNGAGKTTLLNAVSGLLPPVSGRITINDHDVSAYPPHRRAALAMRRTFQHARLTDGLTAIENVLVGAPLDDYPRSLIGEALRRPSALRKLGEQRERAYALLDSMGLGAVTETPAVQLSFGRKKMVDLARALMSNPALVLMDEPTAGLSEPEIETLVEVIERIRPSTAILLVAHHMGFVSKVASRVICLVAGRVMSEGTPQQVQSDPKVLEAYLGVPQS